MTQNPTNTTPPVPGQTPPQGDPLGQTPPTPQGQTPPGQQQQKTPLTDHWTEEDREYIRRLRKEAEVANEQAKALAKAKQEAEDAEKREKGEYKLLSEKYEARVKELEPTANRYNTLAELVKAQLDAQIKEWPDEITFSDPGPDADILTRLAWADKARPRAEKLLQQKQGQAPGNSPNPQPAGQPNTRQAIDEHKQRGAARYGRIL